MAELIKTKGQSSAVQSARVERILETVIDNEIKKVEKNLHFLLLSDPLLLSLVYLELFGE